MSLRLPCMTCCEASAELARAGIVETYLQARAGQLPIKLPGWPFLPWCCCKRPREKRPIDVEAVISAVRSG